jgi:multiple sugar transport system substrate-binding protein
VLVASPRFVRAFELAREVRRHGLDARVSEWSNEWSESFKRGRWPRSSRAPGWPAT